MATPVGRRRRRSLAGVRGRVDLSPATLLLIAALCASAIVLLALYSDLTFYLDEWSFLLHRRGSSVDVFLDPHNEHISILPVAIYKLLLAIFGMDSPLPFQVCAVLAFLTAATLLFVFLRRLVGEWLALAALLPILFLGGAWEDLLLPFQIGYSLSLAFGLGALLVLQRGRRMAYPIACALLIGSMISSSIGLVFAIGIAVWLAWDRARWRQAWVVAVPLILFGLWWLGWGRHADNSLSLQNVATSPAYLLDGLSASLSSFFGLATPRNDTPVSAYDWGRPLLVAAAALIALRLWRLGRVPGWVPVTAAILVSFWLLAGFNAGNGFRAATGIRYQLPGAVFWLLLVGALMAGIRLRRPWLIAIFVVALAATAANGSYLHQAWRGMTSTAENERAALASVELARDTVAPGFLLTSENGGGVPYFDVVDAGSYLSAVDAFGSPAYDPGELAAAPENARVTADTASAAALGVGVSALDAAQASQAGGCQRFELGPDAQTIALPPGGAVVATGSGDDARLRLRRYASESFPVDLGALSGDQAAAVDVPTDRSDVPWELAATGSGSLAVCDRR